MNTVRFLSDNNIGYLSLAACILSTMTIDEAFDKIAPDPDHDTKNLRQQDTEDIVALRKDGVSWSNIGEIFNMALSAVFKRAQRYKT